MLSSVQHFVSIQANVKKYISIILNTAIMNFRTWAYFYGLKWAICLRISIIKKGCPTWVVDNAFAYHRCDLKIQAPIVAGTYPRWSWFEQIWINLHYIWMLLHKLQHFWPIKFLLKRFWRLFSIHSHVKILPPLWPQPTLGDHDLNNSELTLSENASTGYSNPSEMVSKNTDWRFS